MTNDQAKKMVEDEMAGWNTVHGADREPGSSNVALAHIAQNQVILGRLLVEILKEISGHE